MISKLPITSKFKFCKFKLLGALVAEFPQKTFKDTVAGCSFLETKIYYVVEFMLKLFRNQTVGCFISKLKIHKRRDSSTMILQNVNSILAFSFRLRR